MHIFKMLADINALRQVFTPLCEELFLLFAFSEKEDAGFGMQLNELFDDLTSAVSRIFFSGMGSCWCHAYPLFEILFRTNDGR